VDGNLKVSGGVIFSDSTSINSAPKDLPVGILLPFAGSTSPDRWLLCAGQEVSRETYANLFAVIGESYGIGDGGTTFNLPDLRGRIPMGLDNMGGSSANRVENSAADSLGGNAGEDMHQLTVEELANHNHALNEYAGNSGIDGASLSTSSGQYDYQLSTGKIQSAGGNQPHNNMPPYLSLNYIIKY